MSNNINYNKVNDAMDNELKFDSIKFLANNPANDTLTIVTVRIRGGKHFRRTLKSSLT